MVSKYKFEQPEVLVRVKCGIHPWEFAFIGAVAHPFYAVSGPDGHCALPPGLPPGKYTIEAVHPKAGCLTREITVAEGDRKLIDFALEVPMLRK